MTVPPVKTATRLPRHKRVTHPPTMVLTARDSAVIRAVYTYRFLRQDQIRVLLFPSKWAAQYRLVRLYQHRYLNRLFTAVPFGRGQTVYCLDDRGADLLAAELGLDRAAVTWKRKDNRVALQFLEHTLATNGVRIAFELASHGVGARIEDWADEHALRQRHTQPSEAVYIEGDRGTKHRVAVIADGYFVLSWGDKKAHFFVEMDRATIANKRWRRKIRAYMAYCHSGQYQASYRARSLRVLTVTTSPKRLANLKATTEEVGGGVMFWFTTLEAVKTGNVLNAPIWQVAGCTGHYTLIEPGTPTPIFTTFIPQKP